MLANQLILSTYLDKTIGEICPNGYANDADNHGAHFVSHVMGYGFGATCLTMRRGNGFGANIRVQEIFHRCPTVGAWAARTVTMTTCLVFITNGSNVNVAAKVMSSVPQKHVGIYISGLIYHYSNSQHQVVQQTPEQFAHHYAAPDNAMFYGSLP